MLVRAIHLKVASFYIGVYWAISIQLLQHSNSNVTCINIYNYNSMWLDMSWCTVMQDKVKINWMDALAIWSDILVPLPSICRNAVTTHLSLRVWSKYFNLHCVLKNIDVYLLWVCSYAWLYLFAIKFFNIHFLYLLFWWLITIIITGKRVDSKAD